MHRRIGSLLLHAGLLVATRCAVAASVFDAPCGATTSYDVTVAGGAVVFERASPAPRRVELRDTDLRIDGASVRLNAEQLDRVQLFARELRGLLPQVKAIALRGLDLATGTVRRETRALLSTQAARDELDRHITAHAALLRQRIATSTSTRDWTGAAFEHELDVMAADLAPLLTVDVGRQTVTAALDGDLEGAVALQARGEALGSRLQPAVERQLETLAPQIRMLCPVVRQLHELQDGLRNEQGMVLALIELGAR